MNEASELSGSPETAPSIPPQSKKVGRNMQLPGTNYFEQRRMRPLFFGWLCGVLVLISSAVTMGLFWLVNYSTSFSNSFGDYTFWYYGTQILIVIVSILLLLVSALGLPILYGYTGGISRIIRIIVHELIFLVVLLIVVFTINIRFMKNHQNDALYQSDNCPECKLNLKSD